ncbi:MAG TPA: hypothetical protein VJH96_03305 [Patescibacteria group bacterium]|nr:hypothetical protein [Patescibacteria group bacterium]
MRKKIVIILIIVAFILAGISIYFFVSSSNPQTKEETASPVGENETAQGEAKQPPSTALKEYTHEAGFTFSYPESLTIQEKQIRDEATYADITVSSGESSGEITIKAEDSKLKTAKEWITAKKIAPMPEAIEKVEVADLNGEQFTTATQTITLVFDQGILFSFILTNPDNDQTLGVGYKTITETFAFVEKETTEQTTSQSPTSEGEEDIISEEEEIIE